MHMGLLAQISNAVDDYNRFVAQQVERASTDAKFRSQLLRDWKAALVQIGTTTTPTGLTLPRLAVPQSTQPGEIARYLYGEGFPGQFPFVNAAYREMYLAAGDPSPAEEEPPRLFAGLGLAE